MRTTDQQYILSLLQESLKTAEPEQITPVDNRVVANIITRNSILLTVYQKLPANLKTQLKDRYNVVIKQAIVQDYEGECVLHALSDAGLSCIALKGWELMEQVQHWLEKFGMWRFHERMVKLSRVTMDDEAIDADSEVLLLHAFTHGIYGSEKSYKAGRIAAMGGNVNTGKLKSKLAAVFLPYKRMKAQFPILVKWPILLPYCWMKRIVRFLKSDKKKYSRMLDYSDVTLEDYEEMRRFFEAGGVV